MAPVGYVRVSTPDQSLEPQLDALRKAGCGRVFEDVASGARMERPGLDAALAWLREGDTLCVWKLDRLGRSMPHLIETVRSLRNRGIGFRSLTEGIDTATSGGTLVFHVFGALAQFERNLIRERTAAARARGRKGGRKPVMDNGKLKLAQTLIDKGFSVREAAARIRVGKTSLYKALAAAGTTRQLPTRRSS